jgi:hypothetical protein
VLRPLFWRSAIVCACVLSACSLCLAGDAARFETYVTVDYSGRAAALASSTVWSLFGPIDQPGIRLKVDGFASVNGETNANVFSSAFLASDLKALGDVMAGYQFNWESVWVKLYAGAAYQAETLAFWQAWQLVRRQSYGATGAVETFWQGSNGFWGSGNLSWLQFDNTGAFYGRIAYKLMDDADGLTFSAGAETGAMIKNADIYKDGAHLDLYNEYVREGALLNFRYGRNDLTLSGGFAKASDESAWRPYATISYGRKF